MTRAEAALREWVRPMSVTGVMLGALLGMAVTAWLPSQVVDMYDRVFPVATGRAVGVHRQGNEIRFNLLITRRRGGCTLMGVYAYAQMPENVKVRANAERVDGAWPRDAPPGIEIDVGEWRMWPVTGAKAMVLYSHYLCDGDRVSAKIVELPI